MTTIQDNNEFKNYNDVGGNYFKLCKHAPGNVQFIKIKIN